MEIKKIGIIGYGVIGHHIESFIKEKYTWDIIIYYFDDKMFEKKIKNSFPLKDFDQKKFSDFEFYIGLGYKQPDFKKEIIDQLKKNNYRYPFFVHNSSNINKSAKIGNGVVIYPNCNIGFHVEIGEGTILHNSCTVSHDSKIGSCSFLSPSVIVSGNVSIGDNTFAGSGTVFANSLKIGSNVKIGVGSVVTKDIDDNLSVIGNPASIVSDLRIY
ncbi:MAG TPA: acetyltransferase [Chitinophagaceae bacterium]|nr:acetyltransferase [Chitinophagaceae bacterium]